MNRVISSHRSLNVDTTVFGAKLCFPERTRNFMVLLTSAGVSSPITDHSEPTYSSWGQNVTFSWSEMSSSPSMAMAIGLLNRATGDNTVVKNNAGHLQLMMEKLKRTGTATASCKSAQRRTRNNLISHGYYATVTGHRVCWSIIGYHHSGGNDIKNSNNNNIKMIMRRYTYKRDKRVRVRDNITLIIIN